MQCTGYSYEKDCVWKVKCFTIFWEEPCLLVKQGNLIYSGMKKSSMKNFNAGLTYPYNVKLNCVYRMMAL